MAPLNIRVTAEQSFQKYLQSTTVSCINQKYKYLIHINTLLIYYILCIELKFVRHHEIKRNGESQQRKAFLSSGES